MCALLGLAFAQPIHAGFSFQEFHRMGEENADGWGVAWYPDQSAALIKEPVRWGASPHSDFLRHYQQVHSRIYIAHVRHRTMGGPPTHADTHPFMREYLGRHYCFAHNGTITEGPVAAPLKRFQPVGSTDSERLFCYLLGEMAREGIEALDDQACWSWLHRQLAACNSFGKLNCLLTDGNRLFCYRDIHNWKNLVYCHVYMLGPDTHVFGDPNMKLSLEGQSINRGVVIATQPLSGAGWCALNSGALLVLENGRVKYTANEPAAMPLSI